MKSFSALNYFTWNKSEERSFQVSETCRDLFSQESNESCILLLKKRCVFVCEVFDGQLSVGWSEGFDVCPLSRSTQCRELSFEHSSRRMFTSMEMQDHIPLKSFSIRLWTVRMREVAEFDRRWEWLVWKFWCLSVSAIDSGWKSCPSMVLFFGWCSLCSCLLSWKTKRYLILPSRDHFFSWKID